MTAIGVNTLTATRAATVLPLVQERVPAADLDYVYSGAVCVGLNRLYSTAWKFTAADFVASAAASTVDVDVDATDQARAEALATSLSVGVDLVLSAALCTGMEKLTSGTARIVGPFVTE